MSRRTKPPERPDRFDRGRCPATGKVRWTSRAVARDSMRRLRASGDRRAATLGTYHCDACDDWHVGHRDGKAA